MDNQQQQQQLLLLSMMMVLTGIMILLLHQNENGPTFNKMRYRAPIAYLQLHGAWSLASWGDIECREYLRFTKTEIQQLIIHFQLDNGDNTFRVEGLRYTVTPEQAI